MSALTSVLRSCALRPQQMTALIRPCYMCTILLVPATPTLINFTTFLNQCTETDHFTVMAVCTFRSCSNMCSSSSTSNSPSTCSCIKLSWYWLRCMAFNSWMTCRGNPLVRNQEGKLANLLSLLTVVVCKKNKKNKKKNRHTASNPEIEVGMVWECDYIEIPNNM